MITLTTEQAQQIEEALKKTIAGCKAMGWTTVAQEQALATIRAARAQEPAEQEPVIGAYEVVNEEGDEWSLVYPAAVHKYKLIPEERITQTFYAAPVEPVKQEPVGVVEGSGEWGIAGVLVAGVPIGTKLYAAPQPVTTPDVCGEVCVRAKLCYGCGKALDEANAKYVEQAEQEPVAVISESAIGLVKLHSNGVSLPFGTKLYAAPQPVMQEPVAWAHPSGGYLSARYMKEFATGLEKETYTIPLYAAPVSIHSESETDSSSSSMRTAVRTKDLTDDEIAEITKDFGSSEYRINRIMCARAVIAADREKNK